MSTYEKMKYLEKEFGNLYFYHFGDMVMNGYSIVDAIDYLYHNLNKTK